MSVSLLIVHNNYMRNLVEICVYQFSSHTYSCRFKVHRADLSLLETVSRTLTSAQVRIKSEVAASNSQSKTISDHISKLRALLDKKVSL